MGLRYRKSIKIVPGVKLNISKSGISTSIGKPGNTLNLSSKGVRSTIGIPGTGLSYSQMLGGGKKTRRRRRTAREKADDLRFEMKHKFGVNDHEINRMLKLYKRHPRRFCRMSEQELMDYAKGRRSSFSGLSTVGSRFLKFFLVLFLIVLIIKFLTTFSHG